MTVKLPNAERVLGSMANVAVCERVFGRDGKPLSDAIVGTVDCVIVDIGAYWSDQPHGQSGRYYQVETLDKLPAPKAGRSIVLGI